METSHYGVEFDSYTDRFFVKTFQKKYKSHWAKTQTTLLEVCRRIDMMLQMNRADLISQSGSHKLVKLDFSVEGTKISPKASGNRCILHINEELRIVRILLVYSKNDISEPGETAKWKKIIKEQYPHIRDIFTL